MIKSIETLTHFTSEEEQARNLDGVREVVNATILDYGKDDKGYYVKVRTTY